MTATKHLRHSRRTRVPLGQDSGRVGFAKTFYTTDLRLGPVGSLAVLARSA